MKILIISHLVYLLTNMISDTVPERQKINQRTKDIVNNLENH